MRFPILYRYVFTQIFIPFIICLGIFTGILFLARILKLVDLVINKNVPISDMILLFSYIIPRFLVIAIPMSIMLAVLLAFGRLSADSEIVVMRSVGVSLKKLAQPVILFALMATLTTLSLACYIEPWANHRLGVGLFEIAKLRASAGLVAGTFNEFGKVTIYAERLTEGGKRLENVIISDRRGAEVENFLAKNGQLQADDRARTVTLQLFDGSIHSGAGLNYNLTYFDINRLELDPAELSDDVTREGKKLNELTVEELNFNIASLRSNQPSDKNSLKELNAHLTEWHKRFAIPASCLFVAFVAMALGIQPSRGGSTWGPAVNITVGIAVVLLYYFIFALSSAFAKKPDMPVMFFVWLPNIIFAILGIALFKAMQSERWLNVSDMLGHAIGRVQHFISRKLELTTDEQEQT